MIRSPLRRAALAVVLAAGAAAAAPASAGPLADAPLPPPPAGTRRLEVPLPPPAAAAPARASWIGLSAGPFAALEKGGAFAATVDVGFTARPAWWRAERAILEWHLVVLAAQPSYEAGLTRDVDVGGGVLVPMQLGTRTLDATVLEVVPTARVLYPVGPGLSLLADVGVGLYQTFEQEVTDEQYRGRTVERTNVTGVAVTAGAGLAYEPFDRLRIVFQPVALSGLLGTRFSGFSPQLGLAFRL